MKNLTNYIKSDKSSLISLSEKLLINKNMKPISPEETVDYLVDDYLSEVPYKYGKGNVSRQFKTKEDFIKLIEELGINYDIETHKRKPIMDEIVHEKTLIILDKEVETRYMDDNIKFDKFVIINCHKNGEEPGCWLIWIELETKGYRSSSDMVVPIQQRINWHMDADKSKEMEAYYTGMANDKIKWLKELLTDTMKKCSDYIS